MRNILRDHTCELLITHKKPYYAPRFSTMLTICLGCRFVPWHYIYKCIRIDFTSFINTMNDEDNSDKSLKKTLKQRKTEFLLIHLSSIKLHVISVFILIIILIIFFLEHDLFIWNKAINKSVKQAWSDNKLQLLLECYRVINRVCVDIWRAD